MMTSATVMQIEWWEQTGVIALRRLEGETWLRLWRHELTGLLVFLYQFQSGLTLIIGPFPLVNNGKIILFRVSALRVISIYFVVV